VLPFLKAKSSTPRTLTFPTSGKGATLILLSKASRAATMPSSRASLAPALPPSSRAIASRASSSLTVLRARAATSGNLSQKILLSHEGSSQKKRRAWTSSSTEIPCQGRSETVRE
jgi:hypothetical protein